MKFAYNAIYLLLLGILLPWVAWRILFKNKNRRGWGQKLFGLVPERRSSRRCVWIHAVSVGEVNLLVPFVEKFHQRYEDFDVAISTTTETGFDLARQRFPDELVFFCPSDFSWAVNNAIQRLRPDILILTELELWPNLVSVSHRHSIPIALINGRISEKSFNGYRRIGFLVRRLLARIEVALVQTDQYANRLKALGMPPEKIEVCGNIKFDCIPPVDEAVKEACNETRELTKIASIANDEFVFLAGSTQENEDRMAIAAYLELRSQYPNLRLILVPRHPDRVDRIVKFLDENGLASIRRSQPARNDVELPDRPVFIVDVIGELGYWWGRADAGYVGGSMGNRGGQNMIEPAASGVPVCFGPNTENFKGVVDLLTNRDIATVVHNSDDLRKFLVKILENRIFAKNLGERGKLLVASQQGATARTINRLTGLIARVESESLPATKAA